MNGLSGFALKEKHVSEIVTCRSMGGLRSQDQAVLLNRFFDSVQSQKSVAKAETGLVSAWIQPQDCPVVLDGLFKFSILQQRIGEVVMCLFIGRVQPQRSPIVLRSPFQVALSIASIGVIAVGNPGTRSESNGISPKSFIVMPNSSLAPGQDSERGHCGECSCKERHQRMFPDLALRESVLEVKNSSSSQKRPG